MPMNPTIRSRVALYCRVSTSDQTAENQLRALREHAARAGWVILAEFTDNAVSGTREKRPGLDALMAEARRRGLERFPIQRADWLVAGAMTGCVLMTATTQFIPSRLHRLALGLTLLQFGLYALAVFLIDSFLVVIVNYAPAMLLLLALSMRGLGSGRGSLSMIAGIAIQFGASGVQASGVDAFTPLDHNGLYHLISMVGVVFLFHGGRHLDRQPPALASGQP